MCRSMQLRKTQTLRKNKMSSSAAEAVQTSFTVLLLGKTGTGKSTTAKKLLECWEKCRIQTKDEIEASQVATTVPDEDEVNKGTEIYPTSKDGADSVTMRAELYNRTGCTKFHVIDTPGFAGSEHSPGYNVSKKNLGIIRGICLLQLRKGIKINKILYFLPFRGVPERADGILTEEIKILIDFFGKEIWKQMMFVCTNYPDKRYQELGFNEKDIGDTKIIVRQAVQQALGCNIAENDKLDVKYFPLEKEFDSVLKSLQEDSESDVSIISGTSQACHKCGRKADTTDDEKCGKAGTSRTTHEKCHPGFIIKKLVSCESYLSYDVKHYTSELIRLPDDSFEEAECLECHKDRGTEGCCDINDFKYHTQHSKEVEIVSHNKRHAENDEAGKDKKRSTSMHTNAVPSRM